MDIIDLSNTNLFEKNIDISNSDINNKILY